MTDVAHRLSWREAFARALVSGSAASVSSAAALSACSKIEEDSAAGALNGPSQWVWGEAEAATRRATVRHTLVGYLIHHAMSIFWATLHERVFCMRTAQKSAATHCAAAAATATVAYLADYHLAPKRLRPGFKKHLGSRSLFLVYAAFGAGLAITTIARSSPAQAVRPSSGRTSSESTSRSASSQSSSSRPGANPRRSARQ